VSDATLGSPRRQDDLIFDVGLHRGQDTAFYLAKGFRVVAFEANPELVRLCSERFADAIAQGRLSIVAGAIVPPESEAGRNGRVAFWLNPAMDIWGTADPAWVERNARKGTASTRIDVPVVDFVEALRRHGIPYYLKVDIEGCDLVCLRALAAFPVRPAFVSLESDKTSLAAIHAEIDLLRSLGYESFQVVEQSSIPRTQAPPDPPREGNHAAHVFERGCSGLFGRELPGPWVSGGQAMARYRWIRMGYRLLGDDGWLTRARWPGAGLVRKLARRLLGAATHAPVPGWYDTHARHHAAPAP
jgi:FkbM family methyltransferase